MKIRIAITKHRGYYWADILGFPTIAVGGRTSAEARRRAARAVREYLRMVRENVPLPKRAGESVEVLDIAV